MSPDPTPRPHDGFRPFFLRGLVIVLPTALTIGLLVVGFQFVRDNTATPINAGRQTVAVSTTSRSPPIGAGDALKFVVSGGAMVPPSQIIEPAASDLPAGLAGTRMDAPLEASDTWK